MYKVSFLKFVEFYTQNKINNFEKGQTIIQLETVKLAPNFPLDFPVALTQLILSPLLTFCKLTPLSFASHLFSYFD